MERDTLEQMNSIAYANAVLMIQPGAINHENVLQYEFYNFGNVPVSINGMFIDRYFAGQAINPTYLNTVNYWKPSMLAGELDTSIYNVQFLDTYYGPVTVVRKLIIMKKTLALIPGNR